MEDMRMKILASDYDGTLRTEELVDINDVHAIHEFRAAGNMFGLVTGRSMESIQTEIQKKMCIRDRYRCTCFVYVEKTIS